MNRIRIIKDENDNELYQVLITPTHRFDSSFELMLGNWNDENLNNFQIKTFANSNDAMATAYNYPDISWEKLIIFHTDIYQNLFKIIQFHIDNNNFSVEFNYHMMKPEEVKNNMFDRIIKQGQRFRLKYNANDIISFNIFNPWFNNIKALANILKVDKRLRIKKLISENNIIRLIGTTDIGTSYEIVLWTSLIGQWAKWKYANPQVSDIKAQALMQDILQTQKKIDESVGVLR